MTNKNVTLIQDADTLRKLCGDHHPHTPYKVQDHLNAQAQNFVRRSPFVLLSTVSQEGESTISPKGGVPGFVGIGDERTLYLPDQRGNNLIFSLQNILNNPQVGLLFLVPGTGETLRVHGRAALTADEALCQQYPIGKKSARLVTIIEIDTAYFHCSRSLKTSAIWEPESWTEKITISWKEEIEPNLPPEEQRQTTT
ncbi:MAG: pyridoxamine 5'-phosphate oxidase family protein [Chloroflexales bacterium]|nr:pyridoxamine 5'-phosphate oxidase family protein [Chloroflexales bacterium]